MRSYYIITCFEYIVFHKIDLVGLGLIFFFSCFLKTFFALCLFNILFAEEHNFLAHWRIFWLTCRQLVPLQCCLKWLKLLQRHIPLENVTDFTLGSILHVCIFWMLLRKKKPLWNRVKAMLTYNTYFWLTLPAMRPRYPGG